MHLAAVGHHVFAGVRQLADAPVPPAACPGEITPLLQRLIDHFPSGEVAFNGYSRFAIIWAAKHYHGTQSIADLIRSPGFDDPREPERWDPA